MWRAQGASALPPAAAASRGAWRSRTCDVPCPPSSQSLGWGEIDRDGLTILERETLTGTAQAIQERFVGDRPLAGVERSGHIGTSPQALHLETAIRVGGERAKGRSQRGCTGIESQHEDHRAVERNSPV